MYLGVHQPEVPTVRVALVSPVIRRVSRLGGLLLLSAGVFAGAGCDVLSRNDTSAPPLFRSVTDGRIGTDGGASRGVAWADFDQDGDPDLVVTNTSNQWNALYLNTLFGRTDDWREGGPASGLATLPAPNRFVKVTDGSLSPLGSVAGAAGNAEGVAWVDYDGDGDLDLHIVTRGPQADLFFENRGSEGLIRIHEGELARQAGSSMACWADVDGDGWLDVFLVAYRDGQRNTLLRNHGAGRFENIPDVSVTAGTGTGRSCGWGDPNNDGLPDLYVGNAREPNRFFWNRGNFILEPAQNAGHLVEHIGYTYGLSWTDFDGDGFQDLFVANYDVENLLYHNDGTGHLTLFGDDVLAEAGRGASKGHAWGDYDLDGDLDLFVANGTYAPNMNNFLYLNVGNGRFAREDNGDIGIHADTSAGAAWADYDRDGDLDLFVANWGSSDQVNRFYHNTTVETTGRAFLTLSLRSPGPNTHGWGAKVRVKASFSEGDRWMTRWNIPTTGYGSQNDLTIHFGLGNATHADSVEITWPSGLTETHVDVAAGTFWIATEGRGIQRDASAPER